MMDQFHEKRKREGKVDMEFPATNDELKERVVETRDRFKHFVDIHMKAADRAMRAKSAYYVVMDTENYVLDRRFASK